MIIVVSFFCFFFRAYYAPARNGVLVAVRWHRSSFSSLLFFLSYAPAEEEERSPATTSLAHHHRRRTATRLLLVRSSPRKTRPAAGPQRSGRRGLLGRQAKSACPSNNSRQNQLATSEKLPEATLLAVRIILLDAEAENKQTVREERRRGSPPCDGDGLPPGALTPPLPRGHSGRDVPFPPRAASKEPGGSAETARLHPPVTAGLTTRACCWTACA